MPAINYYLTDAQVKQLKDEFDELINRHFDEFSEAVLCQFQDRGIGHTLQWLDEILFHSANALELRLQHESIQDFQDAENQWFERGR